MLMSYIARIVNKPLSDNDIKSVLGEDTTILKDNYLPHFKRY